MTKNPNLNYKKKNFFFSFFFFFFFFGGGGCLSKCISFTKNPNLKKIFFWEMGWEVGAGGGGGR